MIEIPQSQPDKDPPGTGTARSDALAPSENIAPKPERAGGVYALVGFQTAGAWLTIAVLSLWKLRPHLREAWQHAIGRADPRIDRGEPMSYWLAFAIFIGSAAALLVFLHMTGMSFCLSVVWLTIYFLIAVALLRMRAELGPPGHDFHSTGPEHLLFTSIGTTHLGQRDIASVSLF